jgi:hypothetical protein
VISGALGIDAGGRDIKNSPMTRVLARTPPSHLEVPEG